MSKSATHVYKYANVEGQSVQAGDRYVAETAAIGFPLDVVITNAARLQEYVDYLAAPEGLNLIRGERVTSPGLFEVEPDQYAVELSVPPSSNNLDFPLPVRISGLNTRWSAGLWQKSGYCFGFYGNGIDRYRALGVDMDGYAYVPVHMDYTNNNPSGISHIVAGHPVVADSVGTNVFIQVTNLGKAAGGSEDRWHIAVNNPTDNTVTTVLRRAMAPPGLVFDQDTVVIQPGEHKRIPNVSHIPNGPVFFFD